MSSQRKCLKKGCKRNALPREPYCEVHRPVGDPSTGVTGGGAGESHDPPIVISGGSVTIEFDEATFPPQGQGRRANPNKRIRRVEITGDGIHYAVDSPTGRLRITVHVGD